MEERYDIACQSVSSYPSITPVYCTKTAENVKLFTSRKVDKSF